MIVTTENYYDQQTNWKYMGSTQYRDFAGMFGRGGCEARALALALGEWEEEPTLPMKVGSYVDAHFEGTLDIFQAKHPEIFRKTDGGLKSDFQLANVMIDRAERDEYFMKFMHGEKQVIATAEMFGCLWKIRIDNLVPDKVIVDLKTTKSIIDPYWVRDFGYVSFIEYWSIDTQMAIYQKVFEIKYGKKLPIVIAAISKQDQPDIEIIGIQQQRLDQCLIEVEQNMPRILKIKKGAIKPDHCGICEYCRYVKTLSEPIYFDQLIKKIWSM